MSPSVWSCRTLSIRKPRYTESPSVSLSSESDELLCRADSSDVATDCAFSSVSSVTGNFSDPTSPAALLSMAPVTDVPALPDPKDPLPHPAPAVNTPINSQSIKRLCVPSSFLLLLRSPTVTVVNTCYFSCRIMFIFHFKQISENEKIDEERFTLPSSSTFSSGAKHLCLCLIDMRNSEFRRLKIRLPVLPNPTQMNACSMIFRPLLKVLLPRLYSLPFPHMSVHKGLQIWTL